jgi:exopolysaccharide biosynthesis polyprenyl glycosylphosphotransferase
VHRVAQPSERRTSRWSHTPARSFGRTAGGTREASRFAIDMLVLSAAAAVTMALGVVGPDVALPFTALALAAHVLSGSYRSTLSRTTAIDTLPGTLGRLVIAALITHTGAELLAGANPVSLDELGIALGAAVLALMTGRLVTSAVQRRRLRDGRSLRPVLIVGAGKVGARLAERLDEHPEYGLRAVGFLDSDPYPLADGEGLPPFLGGPSALVSALQRTGARHVMLAFTPLSDGSLMELIRRCQDLGVEVSVVPRFFDTTNQRAVVEHVGGLPLIRLRAPHRSSWRFTLKHAMDQLVAGMALVIASPLFAVLALAVRLSSPGPVFFRQQRVGRDGQVFDLLKFRSMRPARAEPARFTPRAGVAPGGVEGEDRRTAIGRFLRRTSLDELPQLINVARGEMSLVGPRPERPEFVEIFNGQLRRYGERHRMKSGMTGWAQVHGLRGQTSIVKRVEWDNYYIENWSLGLDIRILFMTIVAILRRPESP